MVVRLMLRRDLDAVTESLATAFEDDPMVSWLVDAPDPASARRRSIEGFFAPGVTTAFSRGHCYVTADLTAAAIWSPPDVEALGDEGGAALAEGLIAGCGEGALDRLIALGETVGSRHPEGRPHFYLFLLGAAVKGTGAGSRLMQPVLERCDLDSLPAYLESSSARNVEFYRRHGFEIIWEAAPDGGPTLRGMWREPGSARG